MDSSANANGGPRRKDRQVIRKGPPVEGQAAKKKRLRDSERMLKRENLPADIRIDLQRRVKALKLEIEERGKEEREHKLWERYKYVRHVEKTKLTRRIAALSRLSPSPTVSSQLQLLNLHLAYVTHFPRDVKYISLFPKSTSDGAAGDGAGKADEGAEGVTDRMRAEIMEKIRKAVETGDVKRHGWVLRMGEGWESGFKKEVRGGEKKRKRNGEGWEKTALKVEADEGTAHEDASRQKKKRKVVGDVVVGTTKKVAKDESDGKKKIGKDKKRDAVDVVSKPAKKALKDEGKKEKAATTKPKVKKFKEDEEEEMDAIGDNGSKDGDDGGVDDFFLP